LAFVVVPENKTRRPARRRLRRTARSCRSGSMRVTWQRTWVARRSGAPVRQAVAAEARARVL